MTDQEYEEQADRVGQCKRLKEQLDGEFDIMSKLHKSLLDRIDSDLRLRHEQVSLRLKGWIKYIIDEEKVRLREECDKKVSEI